MYSTWVTLAGERISADFDWTPAWTLGGAVVTGVFLLIGQSMVQRAARKQGEAQAGRELSKWHRELRRQSYVDCVVAFEKMRDVIAPLSQAAPWPPPSRALTDMEAAALDALLVRLGERYEEVFQKCQIVRLEGPGAVADAAQQLVVAAAGFRNAVDERAHAVRLGQRPAFAPRFTSSAQEMNDELEAFIELARAVIAVD